ncbi:MAG: hypothetical protein FWD83_04105 [Promicromonosporaceae bacterium]|nr:hypothetical protein [Promicromonosporaceae bacterium]
MIAFLVIPLVLFALTWMVGIFIVGNKASGEWDRERRACRADAPRVLARMFDGQAAGVAVKGTLVGLKRRDIIAYATSHSYVLEDGNRATWTSGSFDYYVLPGARGGPGLLFNDRGELLNEID